jgi:selenocysteine-specific translation elongation factor
MKTGKQKSGTTADALGLLKADHDKVKDLFREFATLKGEDGENSRKAELVDEICYELTMHSMLEEEIFYPALRRSIDDDELLDEADIEHAGARELIGQLEIMAPGDDHFDATVTVLGEEVEHHIEKEEVELFEAARAADIDLDDLGEQLAARKDELEEDLSSPPSTIDAMEPHDGARRAPRPPN